MTPDEKISILARILRACVHALGKKGLGIADRHEFLGELDRIDGVQPKKVPTSALDALATEARRE